ncbi:MAG TPA: hypothetical protein VLW26_06860 [Steroidobacteraceae bacterium]|nr:hypothetical protein [Steroidobacteraceae bacterium]
MLRNRWLRILVGAVIAEVVLIPAAILLNMTAGGREALLYLVIPLCLAATFFAGWWVASRTAGQFVLHGLLVGAIAALIYGVLTWNVVLPTVYVVANYLKLLGGAAGGALAKMRAAKPPGA